MFTADTGLGPGSGEGIELRPAVRQVDRRRARPWMLCRRYRDPGARLVEKPAECQRHVPRSRCAWRRVPRRRPAAPSTQPGLVARVCLAPIGGSPAREALLFAESGTTVSAVDRAHRVRPLACRAVISLIQAWDVAGPRSNARTARQSAQITWDGTERARVAALGVAASGRRAPALLVLAAVAFIVGSFRRYGAGGGVAILDGWLASPSLGSGWSGSAAVRRSSSAPMPSL